VTSTVVIHSKQGIGDITWHLPYLRAIAALSPGGKIICLALPSTHAQELLQAEPCVERTVYFESRGSELQRIVHLFRLVTTLRRLNCDTAWFLDRTMRPALAAFLAGIPTRIGVGLGAQRWFITNRGVDRALYEREAYPFVWLPALMAEMKAPFVDPEPNLPVPLESIAAVRRLYGLQPRPWIVLGLGGSHPLKEWPSGHWIEFIAALRRRIAGTVFLIGGPSQAAQAGELIAGTAGAAAVNACGLSIIDATALLHEADLFVGPDSGPMNLAVAVGTPAFGLFGATRVLTHSRFVNPVLPDDGRGIRTHGMQGISPANVLARIEPHLASSKANLASSKADI
jgi:heptosyltransferase-2